MTSAAESFSINWKYVAAALCQNRLQVQATGLNEVSQVLGGECVELREGRTSRQFYWNALDIADEAPLEDVAAATQLLRSQYPGLCARLGVRPYGSIVHLLSGGLDSSIVLGCLKDRCPARPGSPVSISIRPAATRTNAAYARAGGRGYRAAKLLNVRAIRP